MTERTKENLIVWGMVIFMLLATTADSWGQSSNPKKIVADETVTCMSGEKTFRVITSNDKILALLLKQYEAKCKRQSIAYRKDRHGSYKETSVYFPSELRPTIEGYLMKLK